MSGQAEQVEASMQHPAHARDCWHEHNKVCVTCLDAMTWVRENATSLLELVQRVCPEGLALLGTGWVIRYEEGRAYGDIR